MVAPRDATTGFVRPPGDVVRELVASALDGSGQCGDSRYGEWVETGSHSLVLLSGDVAVRIARERRGGQELRRSQALVDALPALPFDVPRSRSEPIEIDGYVAVVVQRLVGEPHPSGSGDAAAIRTLLDSVHAIDPAPLAPFLAEPRTFMGGSDWHSVLLDRVLPLLAGDVRGEAEDRIRDLADLEAVPHTINHGDLAGSNVLWTEGRVSAVLDWDLAALDDPAEDVAALGVWHGWPIVAEIADHGTGERAIVFRRSFALQTVAFSIVNERPEDELARAVARAERQLREAGGGLGADPTERPA